jgi:hydroxymethylpyrimidine/phosphomethylpyrimidine kinase
MQTVLTIAGFDPSSGAGVTADLMVFAAHGLFGTSCITALTVQSTLGVLSTHPVAPHIIKDTLACLHADLPPAGIKIGMLSSSNNALYISEYCGIVKLVDSGVRPIPIVLDPVLRSSSGRELIDSEGLQAIRESLLPIVDWITPNLAELAALSRQKVERREDIRAASRIIQQDIGMKRDTQPLGIIATGGHLDSPDDYMLTPSGEEFWFPGTRIETTSTHGTGCAFSSAFLSRLVLGDTPYQACFSAKAYVAGALVGVPELGHGRGPLNHLWNIANLDF